MFTNLVSIFATLVFAAIAFSALATFTQFLNHLKPVLDHELTATLARRVIGNLITDLHTGEDFKPYTFEHALQIFCHQMTDLLMMNGFTVRDYNPQVLVKAILAESHMLAELMTLLELRRQGHKCPA